MKFFNRPRIRSDREEALLDAMLKSPMADQAVQGLEDETLIARRALLAQIAALDRDRPAEAKRLNDAATLTRQKLEVAEAAFKTARANHEAAQLQGTGFEMRYTGTRTNLELEVLASADQRLWAYAFQCTQLRDNACQAALEGWMTRAADDNDGEPGWRAVWATNVEHVQKAKDHLSAAAARCREAQMQPLTASDVSGLLDQMCREMAPHLAPLELNPPCLTTQDHEVGEPLRWRNVSEWLADEIPTRVKFNAPAEAQQTQRRLAALARRARLEAA